MKSLVIVRPLEGRLHAEDLYAVTLAQSIGTGVSVFSFGAISEEDQNNLKARGASITTQVHEGETRSTDSKWAADVITEYLKTNQVTHRVIGRPTSQNRALFGRLAVRQNLPVVAHVSALSRSDAEVIATLLVDGGRQIIEMNLPQHLPNLLLTASGYKTELSNTAEIKEMEVERYDTDVQENQIEIISSTAHNKDKLADLQDARVVVVGGRGMLSKENFDELRQWARRKKLGFGASRAAVEAGWATYDELIGQTGTVISPEICISFGVSGAPQHLSGIRASQTVISVNTDNEAPISKETDVMIVGDALSVLRKINEASGSPKALDLTG